MARMNPLAALTLAIVLTVTGGAVMAALDRGEHDHGEHAHLDTTKGLLVTNRSALKVCVQAGTDASQQPAIRASLLTALGVAQQHPFWPKAFGDQAGTLDWGCPGARLPSQFDPRSTIAGPGVTSEPSPYRLWVYVLPDPSAEQLLGPGVGKGISAAELMRDGTVLFPVSTALLVRESRLGDIAATAQDLLLALGLVGGATEGQEAK
jgi:hypothetical protein